MTILAVEVLERLDAYRRLLIQGAERLNLVSHSELERLEDRLNESLLPFQIVADKYPNMLKGKIIDLGSGAGLPGIPLAIAFPSIEMVLLESRLRRVEFLEGCVSDLELLNAKVVRGRAEELARTVEHRGTFDAVTAQALAPLPVLLELAIPFLRVGGFAFFLKGLDSEIELERSLSISSEVYARLIDQISYNVPPDRTRRLLVFQKEAETPERYPRSAQRLRQETKKFHRSAESIRV